MLYIFLNLNLTNFTSCEFLDVRQGHQPPVTQLVPPNLKVKLVTEESDIAAEIVQ